MARSLTSRKTCVENILWHQTVSTKPACATKSILNTPRGRGIYFSAQKAALHNADTGIAEMTVGGGIDGIPRGLSRPIQEKSTQHSGNRTRRGRTEAN